jgi:hypothetical protein
MRSKKALKNIGVSFLRQIIVLACGFLIPQVLLGAFGSAVNGLTESIGQFLGYIALVETGIAGVIRAALYQPLASGDINRLSAILNATEKFYRKIAVLFAGYMLLLALFFPYLKPGAFGGWFTASLIIITGAGALMQYYFGVTYRTLIEADQKRYIADAVQIGTTVLSAVLVLALVKAGATVHIVRLGGALPFLLRPFAFNLYVKRHYRLDKNCAVDNRAIARRWDGFWHHIAYFLHSSTDVTVLTLFTNYLEVSVYAVHAMIVSAIRSFVLTLSVGFEAALGDMIAKKEAEALDRNVRIYELIINEATVILFTSTALLINPFVMIYTRAVTDVSYDRPIFAYILVLAEGIYCLRLPYQMLVAVAGHFKQTRAAAFAEAGINLVLSVAFVRVFGIAGVAAGTAAAILFRTIYYARYSSKNILHRRFRHFVKRFSVSLLSAAAIIAIVRLLPVWAMDTYTDWVLYVCAVTAIAAVTASGFNWLFYRADVKQTFSTVIGAIWTRDIRLKKS